jgi:diguanylate cyclase (GGDEF)-like protein
LERRNHNRLPIRLDAVVNDKMFHSWPFVIEDFGYDGLFLKWSSRSAMPGSITVDDLLDVNFDIELSNQKETYHLEVKVVRILEDGIAAVMFNPALEAMSELSKVQQEAGILKTANLAQQLDKKSLSILNAVNQSFLKDLAHSIEIFLPIVHDKLFSLAEQCPSNSQQALYFDSLNTLDKNKNKLKSHYFNLVKKKIENLDMKALYQNQSDSGNVEELDLIDQNEFENWLTINQIAINVAPHHDQEIKEIRMRLAFLYGIDSKKVVSTPYCPEMIFKCFSETIHDYFLNNDILLILFHQFEKVMVNHLYDVYQHINKIFIDNNILPIIEKKKLEIVKANEQTARKVSQQAVEEPELASAASTPEMQTPSAARVPEVNPQINSQPVNSPAQANVSASPGQHMTEINTIQNDVNLVPTYQTLKELLTFQSGDNYVQPSEEFYQSKEYRQQLNALVDELSKIQNEYAKKVEAQKHLKNEDLIDLAQYIDKEQFLTEIYNEYQYTLDIIRRLFKSIKDDKWLGKPVKNLLSLLEVPILKVALLHKDFFESWSNPARIVINKLAVVDFDDEKNNFFIKARSFVVYLLKNYDKDLSLFSKIQEVLTQLLDIQAKHYNKNIAEITKRWDAQQAVTNELAVRLAGKKIPALIADFISFQWLPTLVSTYLTKGNNSPQWTQYLQALDMLLLSMSGDVSDEFIEQDVILYIIKQGLEENNQYNKKLIDDIDNFLKHGDSGHKIVLNMDLIIKLLINGYALSDKTAVIKMTEGTTDATILANKSIAQRLQVNDYVFFKQGDQVSRLQFVWGSDNQNVFVFAARTGTQAAVFNILEIVSMLDNGQLVQTKDYDLPLLERSLYAILGDVHDDMAQEFQLDQLTGLIERKEFTRQITEYLNDNKNDVKAAICLIDIDRFSLINDTCGYEAGDSYIVSIAHLIKANMPENILLSRYGVDEFALFFPGFSQSEAQEIAETQRSLINDFSFQWEDKEFTLSASVGLVVMPQFNDTAMYLKAVVTASSIAKEVGRNRVHTLEYDALELNHRQELQHWATRVDQMIKNNRLDVRGHRLQPIIDDTLAPHYEMLLLVKDEQSNIMPPGEFIEAAELYNKMADVDRWVIKYVFEWYSNHLDILDEMGGVAINLSGHSLNDVDFLAFIQNAFEQYPVPPEQICFEITETVAITNMNHAINIIHAIKEIGCEFSLDDFGTGQSSYAYLKNLPVDYLKIDGVFIKDIVNSDSDKAMVKSINEIGHFLGMKTVAEYVENYDIVEILREIGVDYAQGFGIEKPILIKEKQLGTVRAN